MRKHLILVVAAAAVLLSVTTAAVGSSSRQGAGPSGSVTAIVPTDPGSLDPQLTIVGAARYVDTYAYDTLVNVTGPGKIVSGLAQSWKVVSPKRVQFTLFKGITCSDGTQMTATVVKQNLDFVGDPKNKSPLLGLFMPIGATVTANNGARTVTVTTNTPQPFMIQGLALVQLVCSKGLADRTILAHGTNGTGPYKLTGAVPGDHYSFSVRKGYTWGPGGATTAVSGLPAKVTVKVVSNETTAANLLLTGGANLASIGGPDRTRLNKAHLFSTVTAAQPNELFFNENPGHPGANPAVRKALVQALDLGQLGTVATSGRGLKMTQLSLQNFTPCAGNSVAGGVPAHNLSAARSALSGTSVKLLYATDAGPFSPADRRARAAAAVLGRGQGVALAAEHRGTTGDDLRRRRLGRPDHRHRRREPVPDLGLDLWPDTAARHQLRRHRQSRLQACGHPSDQAGRCERLQVLARRRAGDVQGRGHRAAAGDDLRQLRQEREVHAWLARSAADEPPADEVR